MRVRELIEVLKECNLDARVIIPNQGGMEVEATTVYQEAVGGIGPRASFQYIEAVHLCVASPGWLLKQGYDVKGDFPECHFDSEFDYEKLR